MEERLAALERAATQKRHNENKEKYTKKHMAAMKTFAENYTREHPDAGLTEQSPVWQAMAASGVAGKGRKPSALYRKWMRANPGQSLEAPPNPALRMRMMKRRPPPPPRGAGREEISC